MGAQKTIKFKLAGKDNHIAVNNYDFKGAAWFDFQNSRYAQVPLPRLIGFMSRKKKPNIEFLLQMPLGTDSSSPRTHVDLLAREMLVFQQKYNTRFDLHDHHLILPQDYLSEAGKAGLGLNAPGISTFLLLDEIAVEKPSEHSVDTIIHPGKITVVYYLAGTGGRQRLLEKLDKEHILPSVLWGPCQIPQRDEQPGKSMEIFYREGINQLLAHNATGSLVINAGISHASPDSVFAIFERLDNPVPSAICGVAEILVGVFDRHTKLNFAHRNDSHAHPHHEHYATSRHQ